MATRVVALLLGNHKTAFVAAGTLVSLASFLFALMYLYAFARDEIGDERAATALWLIAAYPFALFFGAIYAESLYLLAALAHSTISDDDSSLARHCGDCSPA
jgi:Gpi18-like mannosyltransferase